MALKGPELVDIGDRRRPNKGRIKAERFGPVHLGVPELGNGIIMIDPCETHVDENQE
jgi:hypothetical protein